MEFFKGLNGGGFVGVLPLIVLLLICGGGYLTAKRGRADLVDSPWFWSFVFSAVGLLGVWAISGKYDDRQKRVEARYEARGQIAQRSVAVDAADGSAAPQTRSAGDTESSQVGYSAERRVPLHFLAGGLIIASLVSLVMLSRASRSATSTQSAETR